MAPPKQQPQGRMRIGPRGSHANFQPNKFKYGTSLWEHTGILRLGLLINYLYKSKIQKSDQITGCALASNPSIPSFVFQTPKFTPCYPFDKRVRQSPPSNESAPFVDLRFALWLRYRSFAAIIIRLSTAAVVYPRPWTPHRKELSPFYTAVHTANFLLQNHDILGR